jgi:Flp pilus assembly protein TadD
MVINRVIGVSLVVGLSMIFDGSLTWSREASSPSACQAAASLPPLANALRAARSDPHDLSAAFNLADAWSDAGCVVDSLHVLESARSLNPTDKELDTRLRVARSLVGEANFFDNLDRADAQAKLKRDTFRCTTLSDLASCSEALHMKPDDPVLLVAHGDALMAANRPADAVTRYRLAAVLAPDSPGLAAKINAATAQLPSAAQLPSSTQLPLTAKKSGRAASTPAVRVARADKQENPPRHYSNADPETQSH